MNKEIFLRDLRNFLSDLPKEEREQAISYYEDYFEDAGKENEQKVLEELGAPIDVAKQIKMVNRENIEYGKGNTFHSSGSYPEVYTPNQQYQSQYNANHHAQANAQFTAPNRKNNLSSGKVALIVILALLAIPVGLPLVATIFGLLFAAVVTIFSLVFTFFIVAISLVVSGTLALIAGFGAVFSSEIANALLLLGIGLILACLGIFLFWFGIFFCQKIFPAFCSLVGNIFSATGKGLKKLFY